MPGKSTMNDFPVMRKSEPGTYLSALEGGETPGKHYHALHHDQRKVVA